MVDSRQLQDALTEQDQLLRDHFVAEYLKDFSAYRACIRLGFQPTYATVWAETLFNDGYVQRKLEFLRREPETPEQEAMDREMSLRVLRMVALNGSDSARVSAVRQLSVLRGWDKQDMGAEGSEELAAAFRQLARELPT